MSEKEKKIVEKLKEAIPKMSEFDKGYILGKVESFSDNSLEQKTDKKENRERYYHIFISLWNKSILCFIRAHFQFFPHNKLGFYAFL